MEAILVAGAAMLLMFLGALFGAAFAMFDKVKVTVAFATALFFVALATGGGALIGLIGPAMPYLFGVTVAGGMAVGLLMALYAGIDWLLTEGQRRMQIRQQDERYRKERVIAERERLLRKLIVLIQGVEHGGLRDTYRRIAKTLDGLLEDRERLRQTIDAIAPVVHRFSLTHADRNFTRRIRGQMESIEGGIREKERLIDEVLTMLDAAEVQLRVSLAAPHIPARDRSQEVLAIRRRALAKPVDNRRVEEPWLLQGGIPGPAHRFDDDELTTVDGASRWLSDLEGRIVSQRASEREVADELGRDPTFRDQMAHATGAAHRVPAPVAQGDQRKTPRKVREPEGR